MNKGGGGLISEKFADIISGSSHAAGAVEGRFFVGITRTEGVEK